MSDVNTIASGLQAAFALPEGALKVQRATRLWIEVGRELFPAVFEHLVKKEGFPILCTITGLDLGADLGFIYHLARDGGIMANLKTRCLKGDSFPSVTPTFPGASIYEAELVDLLGARIDGLPGAALSAARGLARGRAPASEGLEVEGKARGGGRRGAAATDAESATHGRRKR